MVTLIDLVLITLMIFVYICDVSLARQCLNALKVVSDLVVTLSLFQYFAPR